MNRACFELEGNSYTYLTSRETHTLQGKPHLRLFFLPSLFKSIRPCKFDSVCTSLAFCQRKKFNSRWIYNLFHSGLVLARHRMMASCCLQHGDGLQPLKFSTIATCWQSLDVIKRWGIWVTHSALRGRVQQSGYYNSLSSHHGNSLPSRDTGPTTTAVLSLLLPEFKFTLSP